MNMRTCRFEFEFIYEHLLGRQTDGQCCLLDLLRKQYMGPSEFLEGLVWSIVELVVFLAPAA